MKYLIISVALFTVLLAAAPASGQTQVVSMEFNGWPDCFFGEIVGHIQADFDIKFVNQNGAGCSYFPSCAWIIEGKEPRTPVTIEVVGDLANWEYRIFDRGDINSEVDTIGIIFTPSEGAGPVYDGFDDVALRLHLIPKAEFGSLYVRAAGGIPSENYNWGWAGAEGCADLGPEWQVEGQTVALDSNARYDVVLVPDCCGPEFVAPTPDTIYGAYCETLTGVFAAIDYWGPWSEVGYQIGYGPGTINPSTGVWTWDGATQDDIASPISLGVVAWNHDCNWADHWTTIIVTDKQPLGFTSGCDKTYFVKGPGTRITFTVDADCQPNPLEFLVLDDGGFLGDCFFEDSELVIEPTPEMWGEVDIRVAVTDGVDTTRCSVHLAVTDYPCCGLYTGGLTGNADCDPDGRRNLSDITRMIDHVYISYEPLCCRENGNTDGDDEWEINLSDITRLIDHVYISHAETAPCR
ncbi:MAG: hypothetical protein PVH24_04735 [Candidatus Zixiibacteriota bacterium]|jgi:hypothetical protein